MICPKCGNEMGEGKMYCEVCGEEIQYVPDFEPEIENSITDVLNDVADQIDPSRVAELIEQNEDYDEIETEEFKTEDILAASNDLISGKGTNEEYFISKRQLLLIISVLVGIIVFLITIFSVYISRDKSDTYQMKQGDVLFAKKEYSSALSYYEKAYRLDNEDMYPLYRIADCYKMMGNDDRAIDIYEMIISKDINEEEAWNDLISILSDKGEYTEINSFVNSYGGETQKSKYSMYVSEKPSFSYEDGEYSEMISVEIKASSSGKIYYTTDGSEPGSDCALYDKPIVFRDGTYRLNAVFVNEYGVCSEVSSATYTIKTDAPDEPIVSLEEGHYNVPQIIEVTVPEGAIVYYTSDGSEPSTSSAIYTEPISIPTGDSWYRFVAASKNGNLSEEVQRKYILTVDTVVTTDEALQIVKNKQFEVGRVIDAEGTVEGGAGKYMYSYSDMRYVQGRTYYFVSEYYQEGTIRMVTGNVFAVDVLNGSMFQAVAMDNGTYTLHSFGQ